MSFVSLPSIVDYYKILNTGTFETLGHIDEAVAAFERASKLEPTNEKIRGVLRSLSS